MQYKKIISAIKNLLFNEFECFFQSHDTNFHKICAFKTENGILIDSNDGDDYMVIFSMNKSECANNIYNFIAYYLIAKCVYDNKKLSEHTYLKNNKKIKENDIINITNNKFKWSDVCGEIGKSHKTIYKINKYKKNIIFIEGNDTELFYVLLL